MAISETTIGNLRPNIPHTEPVPARAQSVESVIHVKLISVRLTIFRCAYPKDLFRIQIRIWAQFWNA